MVVIGNRIVYSIKNRSSTSLSSLPITRIQNVTNTVPVTNKIGHNYQRFITNRSHDYKDLYHTGQTLIIRRSIGSSTLDALEEEKSSNTITETNDNSSEKLLHQQTEMEIADVVNKVDAENGDDQTTSIMQKNRPRASSSVNFKMQQRIEEQLNNNTSSTNQYDNSHFEHMDDDNNTKSPPRRYSKSKFAGPNKTRTIRESSSSPVVDMFTNQSSFLSKKIPSLQQKSPRMNGNKYDVASTMKKQDNRTKPNMNKNQNDIFSQPPPSQQPLVTLGNYLESGSNYNNNMYNKEEQQSSKQYHYETVQVPTSNWIRIDNISPISSLDSITSSIYNALNIIQTQRGGILDLDAIWSPDQPLPFLKQVQDDDETHQLQNDEIITPWKIEKAKLILSPFGRPTGWYIKFNSGSIVYSLLQYIRYNGLIQCASKSIRIEEYNGLLDHKTQLPIDNTNNNTIHNNKMTNKGSSNIHHHDHNQENNNYDWMIISDHTIRVENCPIEITETILMNFFSRYDLLSASTAKKYKLDIEHKNNNKLQQNNDNGNQEVSKVNILDMEDDDGNNISGSQHVEEQHQQQESYNTNTNNNNFLFSPVSLWKGITPDGKVSSTPTFIIHFANASYARAAIREKQSSTFRLNESMPIRLIQYPKQILS